MLVFGAMPRPARQTTSATQLERQKAIRAAMKEVEKVHVQKRLAFGLKKTSGPKGLEASSKLKNFPAGAQVYVYRSSNGKWTGPHMFISIRGERAVVQTG